MRYEIRHIFGHGHFGKSSHRKKIENAIQFYRAHLKLWREGLVRGHKQFLKGTFAMRKKLKFFHIIVGNSSSSIASWWYWRYRKIKLPYSYYLHVSRDCENQQWIKYKQVRFNLWWTTNPWIEGNRDTSKARKFEIKFITPVYALITEWILYLYPDLWHLLSINWRAFDHF